MLCVDSRLSHHVIRWYSETSYRPMQTSRCHWHWFQTNWTYPFSPRHFNGIKIVTAFKCIFEETMPKLSVDFGNHISQDSYKNQYPSPVCNFSFTAPQYGDKCWSNLPPKCHIFLIGNTQVTVSPARSSDSCSDRFVWNQLPRVAVEV